MNSIYLIIITLLEITSTVPTKNTLSFQEKRFVNNVVRIHGSQPKEIIKLTNGRIAINYPDQRIILGTDGFIHDLEILEDNKWIDMGPEY